MILVLVELEHLWLHALAHNGGVVFKCTIWWLLESKFEYSVEESICEELRIFKGTVVLATFVFLDADAFVETSYDELKLLSTQDIFVTVNSCLVFDDVFFLKEKKQENDQNNYHY